MAEENIAVKRRAKQERLDRAADELTLELLAFARQIREKLNSHAADLAAARSSRSTLKETHRSARRLIDPAGGAGSSA